jgi:hypothetical protein
MPGVEDWIRTEPCLQADSPSLRPLTSTFKFALEGVRNAVRNTLRNRAEHTEPIADRQLKSSHLRGRPRTETPTRIGAKYHGQNTDTNTS